MARVRDVRVCVFGDSFVAGVGDPKSLGWVGRFRRKPMLSGPKIAFRLLG